MAKVADKQQQPNELGGILLPKIDLVFQRVRFYRKWYPDSDKIGHLAIDTVDFNMKKFQYRDTFKGGKYLFNIKKQINSHLLTIKGEYSPSIYSENNFVYKIDYDASNNPKPITSYSNLYYIITLECRVTTGKSAKNTITTLFFNSKEDYCLFRDVMIYDKK